MIIGRKDELAKLGAAANSGKSEFVAVYGRRRIGDVRREIFLSSIDEKYEPYVKRLEKAFGNRNYIASKKDATTILMTLNEESADNILFYESEFRNSRGFLSLVDIDKIFERIKGASSKEVYYFRSCLAAIYSFSNLYEYYSKDLESAIALKELLETYDFSENKIKNKNVSWLINDLTKYIRELHDPSLDF